MLQIEDNFNQPTSIRVNSFVGEARELSFASSFSYVVMHGPQRRVSERCVITEYKDAMPLTFYLENRRFTYLAIMGEIQRIVVSTSTWSIRMVSVACISLSKSKFVVNGIAACEDRKPITLFGMKTKNEGG